MKRFAVAAAVMLTFVGIIAFAQEKPTPKSPEIRAQGCVEAGVEANCLVVKDASSGKLYNILVKGQKPDVGDGIEFVGVPFEGATVCMQGTSVQVTSWKKKESLKCSEGKVHAY